MGNRGMGERAGVKEDRHQFHSTVKSLICEFLGTRAKMFILGCVHISKVFSKEVKNNRQRGKLCSH